MAECGNAQEMLDHVRERPYDLVVMDISMPGRSGPEALKELKQLAPTLPVLILSMHPEDQYAIRMFKAGAAGYLTKASAPEELVHAAKKVLAGGQYVSASVGEALALTVRTGSISCRMNVCRIESTKCCASLPRGRPSAILPKVFI